MIICIYWFSLALTLDRFGQLRLKTRLSVLRPTSRKLTVNPIFFIDVRFGILHSLAMFISFSNLWIFGGSVTRMHVYEIQIRFRMFRVR